MGTRPLIAGALLALWPAANTAQAPLTIDLDARSVQPGEVVVLTIGAPAGSGVIRVRAFNRAVPAFAVADD